MPSLLKEYFDKLLIIIESYTLFLTDIKSPDFFSTINQKLQNSNSPWRFIKQNIFIKNGKMQELFR